MYSPRRTPVQGSEREGVVANLPLCESLSNSGNIHETVTHSVTHSIKYKRVCTQAVSLHRYMIKECVSDP